ncbi:hypothetical protein K3Z84_27880, partial [Pseudomonas aeruginosa]|nr:hypothetical protein [Pseudomonas aeruginosa]
MVPHDKDKDNPSELIRGKDVAAPGQALPDTFLQTVE